MKRIYRGPCRGECLTGTLKIQGNSTTTACGNGFFYTHPAQKSFPTPRNGYEHQPNRKCPDQKCWAKKKRFQNQSKSSEGTPTEPNTLFFNQPMPMGGTSTGVETSFGKNLNFGQICKRTRNAAAKTSSSFLSHLKFLIMLFLCARMTRLGF